MKNDSSTFLSFTDGNYSISSWMIPLVLALLLVIISSFNFLLFHTLAELFAIIVAILISVVAWQMYPFTGNAFLMYLGCGYFWIGSLDLFHTMTYTGLTLFEVTGSNITVSYWIGTRYLEAFLLLSAPFFLKHSFNRNIVFTFYAGVAGLIIYTVINGLFPVGYIEGIGLTKFKIVSEYVIILMLICAAIYLLYNKAILEQRIVNAMILSIALTICAELAFTFYVGVYDLSNIIGHIFKLFSFWLIFIAMVRSTLQEPFSSLSESATTYDAIPDATIVVDNLGIIRQVNNSACNLVKLSKQELIGMPDHELFHPKDISSSECSICDAIKNKKSIKDLELKVGSDNKYFSFSLADLHGISGSHLTVEVVRDITDKKRIEASYKVLSTLKDSILENLPAMLFVKDARELRYIEWNKAAENLTGLSKEEMLGRNDYDFWPKEEAAFFQGKDREVLSGGQLLDIPEETLSTRNGVRLLHTKKIPIYDHEGKESYLLGISEDITEKQQTELALRQSQKMDALGKLTGGIAHDFNNMLGVVLGFSDLLVRNLDDDDKLRDYANHIHHAGERGEKLTKKLLKFSRQKPSNEAELVNINEILIDEQDMLKKSLTVSVNLEMDLADDIKSVYIEPGDFEDVLLNMTINAMHAMNGSGELFIGTRNEKIDEVTARNLEINAGEYVSLTFSDTGCGMSKETIARIFDPFFSTKGEEGTGLGLSQVYGFVQRSGGTIKVYSELGVGSRFVLYFPAHASKNTKQAAQSYEAIVNLDGTETILVVDDEPAIRGLTEEILTSQGYNVLCAEDAQHAMDILADRLVDLMISDVIMPDENGYELAAKVRHQYPNVKIQMISGFSDTVTPSEVDVELSRNQISKPFNVNTLLKRVRELLDS